jgi:hypothetical protein
MLLGEADAFVIDQTGVLDGIDAGTTNGVFDGLGAMSARRLCGLLVGFFGDGLEFFRSVLRCAGKVALAEHASRGTDLDEVSAIFHNFVNFGAGSPRAIGNATFFVVKLIGEEIGSRRARSCWHFWYR